jgi:inosose dehydratase
MTIHIANAPVSWAIYEFEGIEPKFTYTQVLDEIKATGYTGLELGPYGFLPTHPDTLKAELTARSLRLIAAFVPVRLTDPGAHAQAEAEALKVGRLIAAVGAHFIVLSDDNASVQALVKQAGQRSGTALTDPSAWDTLAAGVNRIARSVLDQTGLRTVFHHHCAGYVETPAETRALLNRVDVDRVGLCLDTGHWHYGGGEAVEAVKEFGDRIWHLHLKDCSPAVAARARSQKLGYFQAIEAGVFCPLGQGEVDFPAVISAMQANGYAGWANVEQDILTDDPAEPKRLAQLNRDFITSLGL